MVRAERRLSTVLTFVAVQGMARRRAKDLKIEARFPTFLDSKWSRSAD